jgi:hypothetical protein
VSGSRQARSGEYLRQIREDHHELRKRLQSVEDMLRTLAGRSPQEGTESTLGIGARSLLNDLHVRLTKHFTLEDRGGYLTDALAAAPRLSRRIEALHQQHGTLSEQLDGVLENARIAVRSGEWKTIEAQFRAFSAALRAHEEEENKVTREAFMDDLGGGD